MPLGHASLARVCAGGQQFVACLDVDLSVGGEDEASLPTSFDT
ncbi:hypothetical protein P4234_01480 [Pseudomonas aeruginosa]|nr:hypothetical protein [Pseudomonas aeruginosa]